MPIDKEVVENRLREVLEAINELKRLASKPYTSLSVDEKYSMRYNIIVLVEALVALSIHIARNMYNYKPRSYVDAIRYVGEKIRFSHLDDLVALIRLRNILIHRYWNVDDRKIYDSIKQDFKCVEEFLDTIEKLIGM